MLRIRAGSRTKRVNSYDSNTIRKPPSGLWHCADQKGTDSYDLNTIRKLLSDHRFWYCTDQEGIDSYVLFGEYTYV